MKKLLFIFFGLFLFFSCEKDATSPEVSNELNLTRQYSKSFVIEDKKGENQVQVTISSDIESSIISVDAENFTLTPIYDEVQGESQAIQINDNADAYQEFEDNMNNERTVTIEYTLIKGGEGVTMHEISFINELNKGWDTFFQYFANGFIGGNVIKTNSTKWTKAKVGVLWQGSSWFYSWQVNDKLTGTGESVQWFTCANFYKIAIKRKNKGGSRSSVFFILDNGFCP